MQESVFMHKSPTPLRQWRMNQARSEDEGKERKRDRKDRGQEADGKIGSPTVASFIDLSWAMMNTHSYIITYSYTKIIE